MQKVLLWFKTVLKGSQQYLDLKQYSVFERLGSFDLYLLKEIMHERVFKPNEVIFEAGYPLEVIYFIKSGEIRLQAENDLKTNKVLGPGEHLGILDLYYSTQRSSTAIAQSKVCVHGVSRTDLEDYINSRPRAGIMILKAINKDLSRMLFDAREIDQK
jgi:CRP-like cAMP-binding protein